MSRRDRIDSLKQDLYKRDPSGTSYTRHRIDREEKKTDNPWDEQDENSVADTSTNVVKPSKTSTLMESWIKVLAVGSAIIFLLAVGFAAYRLIVGLNVVDERKVSIDVNGPVSINGGEEFELSIAVQNNNEFPLEGVEMIIDYPESAYTGGETQTQLTRTVEQIGSLREGEVVQRQVEAVLFGEKDSVQEITIRVNYRVEGSNATQTKTEVYPIIINSSPIILNVDNPTEVNSGQEIDFTVSLTSNANRPMENVLLRVDYPFGFTFEGASPEPRFNDDTWYVGTIRPGEKQVIRLTGRIQGQENEERTFRFSAGEANVEDERTIAAEFISTQETLSVQRPFIALNARVNGDDGQTHVSRMGESNQITLNWENNLASDLLDAEIQVRLTGDALNEQSVSPGSGGFYRSVDNMVLWTKNDNSALGQISPGERGQVSFSFQTVRPSPSVIAQFTNPEVNIEVTMSGRRFTDNRDNAEDVEAQFTTTLQMAADLTLTSRMVYNDGPFTNSGPVPPVAEENTSYTVLWTMTNAFNNVENAEVRASLPSYVQWRGTFEPSDADIRFIPDTREVVWRPDAVSAGTGFTQSAEDVSFQLTFMPSQGQVGTAPVVVNNIVVTGRDAFTTQPIQFSRSPLTTEIATDSEYDNDDGRVQAGN